MNRNVRLGFRQFFAALSGLLSQPIFLALTIIGNSVICAGALGLYLIEHGRNPKVATLLDALWWAMSTITTVGYGDITPVTAAGKLLGICFMVLGTTLFWGFTAIFAAVLISPEVREMEHEIEDIEKTMHKVEKQLRREGTKG